MQNCHRNIAMLTLSAVAFLLAGCASPQVGKWQANLSAGKGVTATESMEFNRDGTMVITVKMPNGTIQSSGTYKTVGNKLIINTTKVTSITPNGSVSTEQNDIQEATLSVKGDKMSLAFKKSTVTFDRAK